MTSATDSGTLPALRDLYAAAAFVTTHAAMLPSRLMSVSLSFQVATRAELDSLSVSLSFQVATRAELDSLAEHFGKPRPADADHYQGAQFSTFVQGTGAYVQVLIYWEDK
jgi:hypothetical protein